MSEPRARRSAALAAAAVLLLTGCSSTATGSLPPSSPSPTRSATVTASANPSQAVESLAPGGSQLSILTCPTPRSVAPACLDTSSNGEAPDLTDSVKVQSSIEVTLTVRNEGATTSPPISVLFFTYEPPAVDTFLQPTACDGCTIHADGIARGAEWPGVGPGDHLLQVTLTAVGRPSAGRDATGNYEWLFAAFAQPYAVAAHGAGGIDVSQAFGTGTGATPITP